MEYFDTYSAESLAGRMAEDTIAIRNGIGAKLGQGLHFGASCFVGLGVGFYFNWKMTLLIFGVLPLAALGGMLIEWSSDQLEKESSEAYDHAGSAAAAAIGAIRTVIAFGRERTEIKRYSDRLQPAEDAGIRKQSYFGAGNGVFFLMFSIAFGVCLWFGGWLIIHDRDGNPELCRQPLPPVDSCMTGGIATNVLFSVLGGMFSLAQVAPNVAAFLVARAKVGNIVELIAKHPDINPASHGGATVELERVRGSISFRSVTFAYPARPGFKVLDNFSLTIEAGSTIALVGSSGCGKSTALQLL